MKQKVYICINFSILQGDNMTKINILSNKFKLEEDIDAIIDGKVKPLGNGAMVIASKKYIGRKAYLVIKKKE